MSEPEGQQVHQHDVGHEQDGGGRQLGPDDAILLVTNIVLMYLLAFRF